MPYVVRGIFLFLLLLLYVAVHYHHVPLLLLPTNTMVPTCVARCCVLFYLPCVIRCCWQQVLFLPLPRLVTACRAVAFLCSTLFYQTLPSFLLLLYHACRLPLCPHPTPHLPRLLIGRSGCLLPFCRSSACCCCSIVRSSPPRCRLFWSLVHLRYWCMCVLRSHVVRLLYRVIWSAVAALFIFLVAFTTLPAAYVDFICWVRYYYAAHAVVSYTDSLRCLYGAVSLFYLYTCRYTTMLVLLLDCCVWFYILCVCWVCVVFRCIEHCLLFYRVTPPRYLFVLFHRRDHCLTLVCVAFCVLLVLPACCSPLHTMPAAACLPRSSVYCCTFGGFVVLLLSFVCVATMPRVVALLPRYTFCPLLLLLLFYTCHLFTFLFYSCALPHVALPLINFVLLFSYQVFACVFVTYVAAFVLSVLLPLLPLFLRWFYFFLHSFCYRDSLFFVTFFPYDYSILFQWCRFYLSLFWFYHF